MYRPAHELRRDQLQPDSHADYIFEQGHPGPAQPNPVMAHRRVDWSGSRVKLPLLSRSALMTNSQEKRVNRIAQTKGYRLEKVGKGPHHGRFCIVNLAEGSRIASGIPGLEFSFSLQEAEDWLANRGRKGEKTE